MLVGGIKMQEEAIIYSVLRSLLGKLFGNTIKLIKQKDNNDIFISDNKVSFSFIGFNIFQNNVTISTIFPLKYSLPLSQVLSDLLIFA